MIEHAIPIGTSSRSQLLTIYSRRVAQLALLLLCFTMLVGCRKPTTTAVVPQGSAAASQQAVAPSGEGATGRNTILQMPFDNVAKVKLQSIGYAYRMAMASGKPPKDAEDLGAGSLKTHRDMQDHVVEVLYGVDPSRLQGEPVDFMLAWEKEPTNDGYRMVLMADFTTVKYVSKAEFEKLKKAK